MRKRTRKIERQSENEIYAEKYLAAEPTRTRPLSSP